MTLTSRVARVTGGSHESSTTGRQIVVDDGLQVGDRPGVDGVVVAGQERGLGSDLGDVVGTLSVAGFSVVERQAEPVDPAFGRPRLFGARRRRRRGRPGSASDARRARRSSSPRRRGGPRARRSSNPGRPDGRHHGYGRTRRTVGRHWSSGLLRQFENLLGVVHPGGLPGEEWVDDGEERGGQPAETVTAGLERAADGRDAAVAASSYDIVGRIGPPEITTMARVVGRS